MRTLIKDFALANPLYKGATVTFYTVANGARTSTKGTLYSELTGTEQLQNPQVLDGYGKNRQAIYHEQSLVAAIEGISVPTHETGILVPMQEIGSFTPVFRIGGGVPVGMVYTKQIGRYMKMGRRVWYDIFLMISAVGSSTGEVTVTGLPYSTTENVPSYEAAVTCYAHNFLLIESNIQGVLGPDEDEIHFRWYNPASTALSHANLQTNISLVLSGSFEVDE